MEGFLQSLRLENRKHNVHVLIACPGFTASSIRERALDKEGNSQKESPRQEQKMMSPSEVANHIYRATINRKRDLILTGEGKMAILLSKFFPSLSDKLTYNHIKKEPNSDF